MKQYELDLSYWKKGDDLQHARSQTNSDVEAFRLHAAQLRGAAETLDQMAALAADGLVKIDNADTHMISLEVDEATAEKLGDMLYELDFYDDGDEDEG